MMKYEFMHLLPLFLLSAAVFSPAANLEGDINRQFHDLEKQIARTQAAGALEKRSVDRLKVIDRQALIWATDRDPLDVALRRTGALLQYLDNRYGPQRFRAIERRLFELEANNSAKADVAPYTARKTLFAEAYALRRAVVAQDPRVDSIGKIVFIVHGVRGGPVGVPSAYDGEDFCDQYYGHNGRPGGLFILENPLSASPALVNIAENALVENGPLAGQKITAGSFLSPDLSFDAKTILFAWSSGGPEKWAEKNRYHIFKINVDGAGLRQLTAGDFDDIHPCFLPGGRIAFMSTRRGGFSRSAPRPSPTYTLHSMKSDGSDIICLSFHEAHEFHPSVDNDGAIVYTRWDHVDRANCIAHHLWRTMPDGRDPRSNHGNYPLPLSTFDAGPFHDGRFDRPDAEYNIRALPGMYGRYVATAAPHHGESFGSLVLIDTRVRDDGAMAQVARLTPEVKFPEVEDSADWRAACKYGTPWPIDSSLFLCNFERGIYVLDKFGNKTLLYECDSIVYGKGIVRALYPIPVRPRPTPPAIITQTWQGERASLSAPKATIKVMGIMNSDFTWAYDGEPRWIRIIQIIPKTTPDKNDPAMGYASESCCRMPLGVVTLEPDGSAYFEAPVGKCIYFQILNERGQAAQSMRTATYVHPGEQLMCIGCHEDKWTTPPVNFPDAWRRVPSVIEPEVPDGAMPFSFYRLVKPVFDAKCASCHSREKKGPDMSYASLAPYVFAYPGDSDAMTRPGVGGSRAILNHGGAISSRVLSHAVDLTDEEFRRITLWLDCNANEFGVCRPADQDSQRLGRIVWPELDVDSTNPTGVEQKPLSQPGRTKGVRDGLFQPAVNRVGPLLVFSALPPGPITVSVFDGRGLMVRSASIEGSKTAVIPFRVAAGVYFARIKSGAGHWLKRIVAIAH